MAKREDGTGPERGDRRHVGCRPGRCDIWREGFGTMVTTIWVTGLAEEASDV